MSLLTARPQSLCRIASSQDYPRLKAAGSQDAPVIIENPAVTTNREALKRVLGIGLASFGLGAGARALMGLRDTIGRPHRKMLKSKRPAVVEVSVPYRTNDESLLAEEKIAGDYYVPPQVKFREKAEDTSGFINWLLGRTHVNPANKPLYLTGMIGAPAAGLYGGYKSVDKFLDWRRKKDMEHEIEKAKEEYRQALLDQYSTDSLDKRSADSTLSSDLSKLYTLCKNAGIGDKVHNALGTTAGVYLPIAALVALGAGVGTYNWVKNRNPENRLAKAIKQRDRLRLAASPPEIYAITRPSPVRMQEKAQTSFRPATAEEEEEVAKIAGAAKVAALYKP